jgi:hypothetical protein
MTKLLLLLFIAPSIIVHHHCHRLTVPHGRGTKSDFHWLTYEIDKRDGTNNACADLIQKDDGTWVATNESNHETQSFHAQPDAEAWIETRCVPEPK